MDIEEIWQAWQGHDLNPSHPPMRIPSYDKGVDLLSLAVNGALDKLISEQLGGENAVQVVGSRGVARLVAGFSTEHAGHGIHDVSAAHEEEGVARFRRFIDDIKSELMGALEKVILARISDSGMPRQGLVLAFTDQLKYSYLIQYRFRAGRLAIHFIECIQDPAGILEIDSIAALEDANSRNIAKSFLTSGHKSIFQNGTLTHVDRRLDQNVFGPSIDTLILAETIQRDAAADSVKSAVEIGCGSGHVISSIARNFKSLTHCIAIDTNPHAVSCTARNIDANTSSRKHRELRKYIIYGNFEGSLFGFRSDLVVCNPPYIAIPDELGVVMRADLFAEAVAGISLLKEVVRASPRVLNNGGRMLLMASSTSCGAVENSLPGKFISEKAQPSDFRVPFDVEQVLCQPKWLEWLIQEGALEEEAGAYFHRLQPYWIREA